ncbi:MAG: L-serine ammonia-lyase [Candidatus Puniceispirillaceae bacterium]
MFVGISDIFKIGVGPSSSHTMGPMSAGFRFLKTLCDRQKDFRKPIHHIRVSIHGSLAFTGKGHATDRAIFLGLLGFEPASLDAKKVARYEADLHSQKIINHSQLGQLHFDPETDLIFDYDVMLPAHTNGMQFFAYDDTEQLLVSEIYYSIGGGFIKRDDEMNLQDEVDELENHPFAFHNAGEMLAMGNESGLSIAEMQRANELAYRNADDLDHFMASIWQVMENCMDRGLANDGTLPGGLNVKRRAKSIAEKLHDEVNRNDQQPHIANDWLSVYAMAVNEENAIGGQVVTAPTNGAAGVIPAVIRYYRDHCHGSDEAGISTFLLTAAAIGMIIKTNASISGAEVGCQGEVGSASAMAAAGLCAALGGTNEQIENAAEIALEHHLGMTCDPVGGLVQAPCIERNGLGAIKAVSAASLALRGDGTHLIPLDNCIETMRQTGLDMHERYKETSRGGLAVNLPEC